jgi:hypothetical protein
LKPDGYTINNHSVLFRDRAIGAYQVFLKLSVF